MASIRREIPIPTGALQVVDEGDGACRITWLIDLLRTLSQNR